MSLSNEDPRIIDVRLQSDTAAATSLRSTVLKCLQQPAGKKSLPTLLLYDERGLRLYDTITTDVDEYYLFPAEEQILKDKGAEVVKLMHGLHGAVDGEVVLELGAGSLRKTIHILRNLASLVKTKNSDRGITPRVTYYALDLEHRELVRTLNQINMQLKDDAGNGSSGGALNAELPGDIVTGGMWGTYEGGIQFIKQGGLEMLRAADNEEGVALADMGQKIDRVYASPPDSSPPSASDSDADSRHTQTTLPSSQSSLDNKEQPPSLGSPPLHIMFLGSTLGNFSREDMCTFLSSLPLRPGSGDTLLLGLDGDNDKQLVERAYNDSKGITREFIMNGLRGAGRALGDERLFAEAKWQYVSWYNETERRHEAYYKSVGAQTLNVPAGEGEKGTVLDFADGELVNIECSHKYSDEDVLSMFSASKLRVVQRWTDERGLYSLYLLERPPFHFPLIDELALNRSTKDEVRSPHNLPTVDEWREMWKAWDFITLKMIPFSMLHEKPIDLRHKCLFYLGHIPAFLDIHLSRILQEPNTEPEHYKYMFERGIDPHVDDPTKCHDHSEVPEDDEDWPTLSEILDFRDRVRQRLMKLYGDIYSGKRAVNRRLARVLFMMKEHEGLHAETLLYMLIQRAGTGTIPPPLFTPPSFDVLAKDWDAEYSAFSTSSVVKMGPQSVMLGHDDRDGDDFTVPFDYVHDYGWDNESPQRKVDLGEFTISWRPVTNGEFRAHWSDPRENQGANKVGMPTSWVVVDGELCVRTLYGPIKFAYAQHWPLLTSYDDLSTYARIKGGRIPTLAELRAFWDKFQSGFVGGGNVGFRNWHPVPATTGRGRNGGRGHNGGVWEWTSTKLDRYEGYERSEVYPGYSMDFFDDMHHVVIGGSYASIPQIAQRKSFCNFYQHNYPYAWVGARIVYDA